MQAANRLATVIPRRSPLHLDYLKRERLNDEVEVPVGVIEVTCVGLALAVGGGDAN